MWYYYFENGNINQIQNYTIKDNETTLHGLSYEFYENGSRKIYGEYSNGSKTGTWYYFDAEGDYKKYKYIDVRVGAICNDGWESSSTGKGTCSHHGGVAYWLIDSRAVFIEGTGKY